MVKINTNFPLKTDSLMQEWLTGIMGLKKICLPWCFYSFYNIFKPLCTRGALNFEHLNMATGKGHHFTGVYNGHLSIVDTSTWSHGVHNSEVPLYTIEGAGKLALWCTIGWPTLVGDKYWLWCGHQLFFQELAQKINSGIRTTLKYHQNVTIRAYHNL